MNDISEALLTIVRNRITKEKITEMVVFISLGSIFGIEMVVGLLR